MLTFSGEIYNFTELRRELAAHGHDFRTLFSLISRERLTEAYSADPRLPGMMAIRPSSTAPVAFLLDINRWLERSCVTIR